METAASQRQGGSDGQGFGDCVVQKGWEVMISRATLDRLLLLQYHANGGHQSDVDEFSMALLEESKDLLDAAVGYVCMREQGDALADELEHPDGCELASAPYSDCEVARCSSRDNCELKRLP
jgi:hypothetical protein